MRIKYEDYAVGSTLKARATVWCLSEEIEDNGDGTYGLVDTEAAESLGFGSEILVIDNEGLFLFWDDGNGCAYNWSGGEFNTADDDNGGAEQ